VLITLGEFDEQALAKLLPLNNAGNHGVPPTVVVIGSPDPHASAAALRLGAADALVAPIHLPELCARLYARLRERRQVEDPGNGRPSAAVSRDDRLEHRVQEEFERARRYSLSFSLVLLGIDELQGSEERLGLEAASRLRSEVSRTLRRELRIPDLVVPYGLHEFAIILPETGETGARQSVVRVRERLTSLPFDGDPRLEATRFSAGIVTFPHPAAQQPDDLFAMAEAALLRGRAQSIERIGVAV
jgi:diguanylate cyclase (GGDEF)-like protein